MKRVFKATSAITLFVASAAMMFPGASFAFSFSDVFFFGDSLSDTGNRYKLLGSANDDGLLGGLATKEQSWTWQMSAGLGFAKSAEASLLGGNNYSYGGAAAAFDLKGIPSMKSQIGEWESTHSTADANALYVLVGGHNDVQYAGRTNPGTDPASQASRQVIVDAAIQSLKNNLLELSNKGAKHVMVSSMMDLGNTFAAISNGFGSVAHDMSMSFNSQLPSLVAYGQSQGLDITFFDLNGVLNDIRYDAQNNNAAKYGITNLSTPCTGQGSIGGNCSTSLYADDVHPSALAHQYIAQAALRSVSAVPEPETYAMMLAGLGLVGSIARRRKAKQTA